MGEAADVSAGLRKLSAKALRDLDWPGLAAYIDALNEEHEWFLTQINKRKIGAHVYRTQRPSRV